MLTSLLPRLPLRGQRGFTLVETLVAMVTGIIVTGALFTILEVSMKQSSRISEAANSTQRGRATMTRIQDALHSGCISPKFTPVEPGSTPTKLVFVSGYTEKAEIPSTWTTREVTEGSTKKTYVEGIRKDEFEWNETAKTLTDTWRLAAGESGGVYSWGTPKTATIGEQVTKIGTTPIFQYYEYNTAGSTSTNAASSTLTTAKPASGTEFKETEASKIAAVAVSFNTAPITTETVKSEITKRGGRTADLTAMTTFAFSAPNSEATITAGPCE